MDSVSVSLNLCDLMGRLTRDIPAAVDTLSAGQTVDRLYLGSYYCDRYFLHTPRALWQSLLAYAADTGKKVTLVLPPVFERNFDQVQARTGELLRAGAGILDEIAVNDLGTMTRLEQKTGIRLHFGRLMQKDSRDIRYEDFFNSTHTPRVFDDYYRRFFAEHHIAGVELDCTHAALAIPAHGEELTVAVHTPYCCTSVGSICEFASVHRTGPEKFLYAGPCRFECNSMLIECTYEKKYRYIRLGRSVQFENGSCRIQSAQPYRTVYTPVRELRKGVVV